MDAKKINFAASLRAVRRELIIRIVTISSRSDMLGAHYCLMRSSIGMPAINATSFLVDATLTPTCQSRTEPGGFSALFSCLNIDSRALPLSNAPPDKVCGVVKAERGIVIFHIVHCKQFIDFRQLSIHSSARSLQTRETEAHLLV